VKAHRLLAVNQIKLYKQISLISTSQIMYMKEVISHHKQSSPLINKLQVAIRNLISKDVGVTMI